MAMGTERPGETSPRRRLTWLGAALTAVAVAAIVVVAWPSPPVTSRTEGEGPLASAVAVVAGPLSRPVRSQPVARTFNDRLDYEVRSTKAGDREFCTNLSTPDLVVLGHIMGCADEMILMQPSNVDCGPIHGHPTSALLADVLLEHPGLGADDLGPIVGGGSVPAGLFRIVPTGRVVDLPAMRKFDPKAEDPDRCRLVADHPGDPDGSNVTDVVEIRGDLSARYVLFDTAHGLVVVGVSLGGHDGPSARAAHARGYGSDENKTIDHMLDQLYDIVIE